MTAKQFYTYYRRKLVSEHSSDSIIANVMFDKALLYYYLSRYNQSLNSSIKDYIRFLRQARLNLFPNSPPVSRRIKLNGTIGSFYREFSPASWHELQTSPYKYERPTHD